MTGEYPLPDVDAINRPFWERAADGRLALQRCADCGEFTYPPRVTCPRCFGSLQWEDVSGEGTLYTYGIVHRPTHPEAFADDVPFVLGVVELDVGPRIAARVVGSDPEDVEIGMEVAVAFEDAGDGISLPVFEPRE